MTLELSAAPWKRQQLHVAQQRGVTVTDQPLRLVPTSSLVVEWFASSNLADLADRLVSDCKPSTAEKEFFAELLHCPNADRDRCSSVGKVTLSERERSGVLHFDDLDSGKYLLEVRYRDLPPLSREVTVRKFDEENVRLPIEYSTLFGKISIGSKEPSSPVKIDFFWNGPPRAVSDSDLAANKDLAALHGDPEFARILRKLARR